jgi:hypothetical protein
MQASARVSDHEQGHVVVLTGRELAHDCHDVIANRADRRFSNFGKFRAQSINPEYLLIIVHGFREAIGVEQNDVTCLKLLLGFDRASLDVSNRTDPSTRSWHDFDAVFSDSVDDEIFMRASEQ